MKDLFDEYLGGDAVGFDAESSAKREREQQERDRLIAEQRRLEKEEARNRIAGLPKGNRATTPRQACRRYTTPEESRCHGEEFCCYYRRGFSYCELAYRYIDVDAEGYFCGDTETNKLELERRNPPRQMSHEDADALDWQERKRREQEDRDRTYSDDYGNVFYYEGRGKGYTCIKTGHATMGSRNVL